MMRVESVSSYDTVDHWRWSLLEVDQGRNDSALARSYWTTMTANPFPKTWVAAGDWDPNTRRTATRANSKTCHVIGIGSCTMRADLPLGSTESSSN